MTSVLFDNSLPTDPWIYPLMLFGILLVLGLFTVNVKGFTINGNKYARITSVVLSFGCLAVGIAGEKGLLSAKAEPEPIPQSLHNPNDAAVPCSDVTADQLDEGGLETLWKGYLDIGDKLLRGNNAINAIKMYEKSIAVRPAEPQGYLNWGQALNHLGKYDDAVDKLHIADEKVKQETLAP